MRKLTFTNQHGTYTIETFEEYETLNDIADYLIKPLMLAAGYHPESINKIFEGTEEL